MVKNQPLSRQFVNWHKP